MPSPRHGLRDAKFSTQPRVAHSTLILNAVVLAEIAPRFTRIETPRAALPSIAVVEDIPVEAAFLAGHAHASYQRAGGARQAVLSPATSLRPAHGVLVA